MQAATLHTKPAKLTDAAKRRQLRETLKNVNEELNAISARADVTLATLRGIAARHDAMRDRLRAITAA